ncbi:MAG: hypothetical protein NC043_09255 [Muribaculaceae bacterium]|nr:hypothetical protein [Muribaculaceae bacterium]
MKKSIIALAAAAVTAFGLYAATDEEVMVIKLTNGETVTYNVSDIEKVNFEVPTPSYVFTVTPPAGAEAAQYTAIPTMLRVNPTATGDATQFGFGTVEAATAEDFLTGDYGVYFTLSASKVYQGEIDLAADKDSYVLKVVKYTEGGAEYILEDVTEGTLSTQINSKDQKVTMSLNATFKDGTVVTAEYSGRPTNVESLEAMIPGVKYSNEIYYYDFKDNETQANVTGVTLEDKKVSGQALKVFTFALDKYVGNCGNSVILGVPESFITNGGTYELANEKVWQFQFGTGFALFGENMWANTGNNGTLTIQKTDDNYSIHIEIKNSYTSWGTTHDNEGRVILNYEGPVE